MVLPGRKIVSRPDSQAGVRPLSIVRRPRRRSETSRATADKVDRYETVSAQSSLVSKNHSGDPLGDIPHHPRHGSPAGVFGILIAISE